MTREELEAEVLRLRAAVQHLGGKQDRTGLLALLQSWDPLDEDDDLRELLERRSQGEFVDLDESERRDQEMIARKFAGRLPADQRLSRDQANSRDPWDLPASLTRKPDEDC
jgi:hypothetical protein